MSKKEKIRVGFTKAQHEKVHAFLDWLNTSGLPQAELGEPIKVTVDWSKENELGAPHVRLEGKYLEKTFLLKDILEADDSNLKGPILKVISGGKDDGPRA